MWWKRRTIYRDPCQRPKRRHGGHGHVSDDAEYEYVDHEGTRADHDDGGHQHAGQREG